LDRPFDQSQITERDPQPSHADDKGETGMVTRRSFLQRGVVAAGGLTAASPVRLTAQPAQLASTFIELLRVPDRVTAYGRFEKTLPAETSVLRRNGTQWTVDAPGRGIAITTAVDATSLSLTLDAPTSPVAVVHVRWQARIAPHVQVLGDAWERSYGDLGWRNLIPERVLPWYFATHDGALCHAYGVKTDAAALCFWQLDQQGVSLWLNVANGGDGVVLGARRLMMATVVTHRGGKAEPSVDAVTGLCRQMCARATRPSGPIYGANDWNYSYGHSTAESILRDTEFIVELSPSGGVRPFSVIDEGWVDGTAAWPDMAKLAAGIRERHARPGIWIRPLEAPPGVATGLVLPGSRFGEKQERARAFAYDPTIPDAQEKILEKVKQVKGWGYDLIKHDFSTYDLLGQWGFEMGPQPTLPGWSLHDRSRTNAEVILDLYVMLRQAAGEAMLLEGCNTIGQLGQGIFNLQRTGDDTSGRQWERTRRMGVNTLSFRLPQHGTFFSLDADLVGITDAVPWSFSKQWLDVLARSGAVTMVSPGPAARGPEQRAALRAAFAVAAAGGLAARPLDWLETDAPERWQGGSSGEQRYDWNGVEGASPFLSP
jgi:alpha-galactosidase